MTEYVASEQEAGSRLDLVLAGRMKISRSQAQQMLREGLVLVNGTSAKPSYAVIHGDIITVRPATQVTPDITLPKLNLVYQDADLMIIDKPAGVLVHSGAGSREGTIADAVRDLVEDTDSERPGIVHRLDRNTSGLMIVARTVAAKEYLQQLFRARQVHKVYQTLVVGHPSPETAVVALPLGRSKATRVRRSVDTAGRPASTRYSTLVSYPGFALLPAEPQTGRTHQIRAHLSAIGHPVAGDRLYGAPDGPAGLQRQFLHAHRLQFIGPHGQQIDVVSPLPPDLQQVLDRLGQGVY